MTKEDIDLIGEAIDFYNLNHFKGKETKKRLVKLKDELKQFVIPVVSQQRELLKALYEKHYEETGYVSMTQDLAEGYLKSLL